MDGVLIIDKPAGPTSHDVVARVRRATRWRKIGHTGTLDPMATGVLALVVGRATRLAQFLSGDTKVYEAEVRLGWATNTYDAEGTPIPITGLTPCDIGAPGSETRGPLLRGAHDDLDRILERFRGTFEQTPPAFSAKKIEGVRAYALARQGLPTRAKPVPVTVHHLSCVGRTADTIRVRLVCSAGFYVRAFAHDLGLALGVGGHLSALRRTRCGEFDIADSVRLDVAEQEGAAVTARMQPLDRLLPAMPAAVVTQLGAVRARHGNSLRPVDFLSLPDGNPPRVRVLDEQGCLLAVADRSADGTLLHPGVVVR